jgi:2,4-dienoyl-CoA reductase-like NADH-dependent reductase (Old Yellow Enzyme family)
MTETLLFSPMMIRGVTLKNRIVVPPMHQYSAQKGFPTDWHLMNAGKFAAGGAGLVVVESTKVERRGCGTVGDLGIWDDGFVEPLGRLVKFIRQQNAAAGIQLGHSGRKARASRPWEGDRPLERTPDIEDWDAWQPVAPSAIAHSERWPVPKALETHEVKDLIEAWGQAARRAHAAGFDVLELHGAHGYLVHEFLSERSNQRTDEYGGTLENRLRFPLEVFHAVREVWPETLPMSVRVSAHDWVEGGITPDDAVHIARAFKLAGADLIDCSSGQVSKKEKPVYGRMFQTPFADRVRNEAGIATIAVGAISEADHVNSIIAAGRADLCAVARPHLANPAWTLMEAAKIGYLDLAWPKQYQSGKVQLERNLDREKAIAAQGSGLSALAQANRALGV